MWRGVGGGVRESACPWGPLVDLKIGGGSLPGLSPSSASEKRFISFTGKVDQSQNPT